MFTLVSACREQLTKNIYHHVTYRKSLRTPSLGNWLSLSVTSSNFSPGKICPFCAKYSLLVSVAQIIFMERYQECLIFNYLLPKCPWYEMGQASAMTCSQFPKYPCDREVNVAKRLIKGHFYSLLEYRGTL